MGPETANIVLGVIGLATKARSRMAKHRGSGEIDAPYIPGRSCGQPENSRTPDSGRQSLVEKPRKRATR